MSTNTVRRLRLVVLAAGLALAAGGCAPDEPSAAALVGGRRISTDQLQSAVTTLRTGNPQFAQVPQLDRLVLFDLIAAPYLLNAAQAEGVGVSPSEAQSALPKAPNADPSALRALSAQIALNRLTQGQKTAALATVGSQLRKAGVRVSPRLGRFDTASLTIVDAKPNWLVPTPTPTAAPKATP